MDALFAEEHHMEKVLLVVPQSLQVTFAIILCQIFSVLLWLAISKLNTKDSKILCELVQNFIFSDFPTHCPLAS